MASTLQAFTNDAFGTVRTIEHEGKVYFCGRDVATALGYVNTKDALARHCKGVVKHYPLQTAGGIQQVRFITEGDLYRLVASSKLPAAQKFESWIFDEVLPSIRRHGLYAVDELVTNPEALLKVLHAYVEEKRKTTELTLQNLAQSQALAEAKPKLSYYDLVLQSKDALPITVIAKDYGFSGRKLNQLLHELGIQYKQSGVWLLYAQHARNGYTDTKTHVIDDGNHTKIHTYWTQKGRLFIYEQLKNRLGILPSIEQDGGN